MSEGLHDTQSPPSRPPTERSSDPDKGHLHKFITAVVSALANLPSGAWLPGIRSEGTQMSRLIGRACPRQLARPPSRTWSGRWAKGSVYRAHQIPRGSPGSSLEPVAAESAHKRSAGRQRSRGPQGLSIFAATVVPISVKPWASWRILRPFWGSVRSASAASAARTRWRRSARSAGRG